VHNLNPPSVTARHDDRMTKIDSLNPAHGAM